MPVVGGEEQDMDEKQNLRAIEQELKKNLPAGQSQKTIRSIAKQVLEEGRKNQ